MLRLKAAMAMLNSWTRSLSVRCRLQRLALLPPLRRRLKVRPVFVHFVSFCIDDFGSLTAGSPKQALVGKAKEEQAVPYTDLAILSRLGEDYVLPMLAPPPLPPLLETPALDLTGYPELVLDSEDLEDWPDFKWLCQ
mmetsp:Transcript_26940/g.47672  ORF Transcript_26940/g.47672 Transcript_26940/m.47672 type:complete len:137 (-) Transcript_26940:114-524(-)